MGMSFHEYTGLILGCYAAMPDHECQALHAWEEKYLGTLDGYGTSDCPGWEKYIGTFQLPERVKKDTFGYVYLIQSEAGFCKIGSSKSVITRLKQLQCANPQKLSLIHKFPSPNAAGAERELHGIFAHRRVRNEWFDLTEQDIIDVLAMGSKDDG